MTLRTLVWCQRPRPVTVGTSVEFRCPAMACGEWPSACIVRIGLWLGEVTGRAGLPVGLVAPLRVQGLGDALADALTLELRDGDDHVRHQPAGRGRVSRSSKS